MGSRSTAVLHLRQCLPRCPCQTLAQRSVAADPPWSHATQCAVTTRVRTRLLSGLRVTGSDEETYRGPHGAGGLSPLDGVEYYRIDGVEQMEPFLMTVVSDSDLWMFVSSTGALTAGRIDADHACSPTRPTTGCTGRPASPVR